MDNLTLFIGVMFCWLLGLAVIGGLVAMIFAGGIYTVVGVIALGVFLGINASLS